MAGRAAEGRVVSQYNLEYCGRREGCLCRKTGSCVTRQAAGARVGALGARGALGPGGNRSAGRAAGARARRGRARGAQAAGSILGRHGRAGAGRRRGRWARGARPGRACARRLGVLAGQLGQVGALCTWLSFDSVFDPV